MRTNQNAINLVATADAVAKNVVGIGTREGYFNRIVELILWLYHNDYTHLLSNQCKSALEVAIATDTRNNRSCKQVSARNSIKSILKKLNSKDSNLSPVKLASEGDTAGDALSWDVIAEFFDTKQKIVQVDKSLAMEFKKKLDDFSMLNNQNDGVDSDETIPPIDVVDNDGQVRVAVRLEASTYDGFRSAICHLYRESNVKMPDEMTNCFSRYIKGSKRINLAAKQTLGLKISEGKSHMTVAVYEFLCKTMFQSRKPEHVFAHTFTVLDWNLMKRAENVVDAKIAHISFSNDAMVFMFSKSKSQQDGAEEYLGPWHVYANPQKPWLCPILAIARFCFMYPEVFTGNRPLFEGKNSYSRYQKVFTQLLHDHSRELRQLGVEPSDLGTHSARKGVGTLVAAGCTVAPPIISICLRMGWALGGVLGRYFKHGDAGDQSVGRMASKMNPMEEDYSVCRPYFDFSNLDSAVDRQSQKEELDKFLAEHLPSSVSCTSLMLARELYASICFHHQYLDEHLHASSPFRDSPFFKDIPQNIMERARIAYPWDATCDTPIFTGIPPHASLLAKKQRELQNELEMLRKSIGTIIGDELNSRGVGCTEFYTRGIENAIKDLENNLKAHYSTIVQESRQKHDELLQELDNALNGYDVEEEMDLISEDCGNESEFLVTPDIQQERSKRRQEEAKAITKRRKVTVGVVKGVLTTLPSDFKFPQSLTARQLVHNWFIGNNDRHIVPYRRLTSRDLKHVEHGQEYLRKMCRFMAVVKHYGKIEGCWIEKDPTQMEVKRLWETVSSKYLYRLYCQKVNVSRQNTGSWFSLLNRMIHNGAFKKARDKCKSDEEWSKSIYNENNIEKYIATDD